MDQELNINSALNILRSHIELVSRYIKPCYAVGGCVRDALLGKEPSDFDFATPLSPQDMEERLKAQQKRAYTTGKRFGTIGFKEAGEFYEVTSFRSESYRAHSRHPEVSFTSSLELDLQRRDFTINAMAYDGSTLIDPHGGQRDLLERRIVSVGNPLERLQEDPLRILRAARLSAQLGFSIDSELAEAMNRLRFSLLDLSQERITTELTKLLCAPTPLLGLANLSESSILALLFCELSYLQDSSLACLELARSLGKVEATPEARWAVLFAYMTRGYSYQHKKERNKLAQKQLEKYASFLRLSKKLQKTINEKLDQAWKFWIFD